MIVGQQQPQQFAAVPMQQVQMIVAAPAVPKDTQLVNLKLQEYRSRNSCWKTVAIIFFVIDLILVIQSAVGSGNPAGYSSIFGLILWGCWYRSSSLAVDAVDTKNYGLIDTAQSTLMCSIVLLWINVIIYLIVCIILLVFMGHDDDFVRLVATILFIVFFIFLLIHAFFLYKAHSLRSDATILRTLLLTNNMFNNTGGVQPVTGAMAFQQPMQQQQFQQQPQQQMMMQPQTTSQQPQNIQIGESQQAQPVLQSVQLESAKQDGL